MVLDAPGHFSDADINHANDARLLNEFETANRLGLSVKTLRRWRWAGQGIPFIKLGRSVRYDPAEIEAFIAAGRRVSTSDPGEDSA